MDEKATNKETNYYTLLLPYIGPLLILLGVSRLVFFYMFFGVEIVRFLEFTEILTSFLDVVVLGSCVFLAILTSAVPSIMHNRPYFDVFIDKENTKENYKTGIGTAVIIMVVFLLNVFLTRNNSYTWYYRYYSTFLFIGLTLMGTAYFIYWHKDINPGRNFFIKITALITVVLLMIMYNNYIKFTDIKYGKRNKAIQVIIDSGTVKTDNFNYYIGNTRNYVFIHHEKDNITSVIPMSRVKEINFVYDSTRYK